MISSLLGSTKQLLKRALTPLARQYTARRGELDPARWELEVDAQGRLTLDGVDLPGLLKTWGSPLHVVHARKLRANVAAFQSAGCEVYYSYKTNPIPGVLRQMHGLGVGAEAISAYELWLAFRLGVPPEQIIYNGPAKSDDSIREAIQREILLLNVNHREEIARVDRLAREVGKRPRVGVRVAARAGWAAQFGTSIASGEAMQAFREATACGSLNVCGLHSHIGGGIRSREQLLTFLDEVLAFTDQLHQELGLTLEFLDLGGSLATPTVQWLTQTDKRLSSAFAADLAPPSPDEALSISDYVKTLRGRVEEHFRARGRPMPRVLLEPGRAMTGNTQLLLASVMTTKSTPRSTETGMDFAILDAGINLAESMRAEFHQLFPANKMTAPRDRIYRLAGPICSPGDVIRNAWRAPSLVEGDVIAIMDAGAYFVPFATSFSFPQPAVVLLDEGKVSLLRRAETFEDLISFDT